MGNQPKNPPPPPKRQSGAQLRLALTDDLNLVLAVDVTSNEHTDKPSGPVTIFLPEDDSEGFKEHLAYALTLFRQGYDVDLRHFRLPSSNAIMDNAEAASE